VTPDRLRAATVLFDPARIVRVAGSHERVEEEPVDADAAVWEPEAPLEVDATRWHHRHAITPYDGLRLYGASCARPGCGENSCTMAVITFAPTLGA
jgi:dihydroorotase-like cyclic amidohydrolase